MSAAAASRGGGGGAMGDEAGDPGGAWRYSIVLSEKGRMMEGPRHQHLHQEWQEPLEEPGHSPWFTE